MSQPDESAALLGPSTTSKPQPPAQPTSAARTRDFILGIALLLLVVALWTASSFITNQLETGDYNSASGPRKKE